MCGARMVPGIPKKWCEKALPWIIELGDLSVWVEAKRMDRVVQEGYKE